MSEVTDWKRWPVLNYLAWKHVTTRPRPPSQFYSCMVNIKRWLLMKKLHPWISGTPYMFSMCTVESVYVGVYEDCMRTSIRWYGRLPQVIYTLIYHLWSQFSTYDLIFWLIFISAFELRILLIICLSLVFMFILWQNSILVPNLLLWLTRIKK